MHKLVIFFCILTPLLGWSNTSQGASEPCPMPRMNSAESLGFVYFSFDANECNLAHATVPCAGFGVGYRRIIGNLAADISVRWSRDSTSYRSQSCWTLPRVSLLYLRPSSDRGTFFGNAYVGGGLAWGAMKHKVWARNYLDRRHNFDDWECHQPVERSKFVGIIPSLTAGYQLRQAASILGFAELTLSQPALPVHQEGRFPGPSVQMSVGVGF